ncbi:hypothetical protein EAX61_00895 [Dokdonia sinensis]|uniref:Vitellogenin II n=1 Tax=Dokdonia sinensis TaxID=2479847 RepID=A0A3M0GFV7_9FLAO|nr:hypothetical protein [Dokdonia sinensis]RMB63971.1 hypothetical protein EAX61_00895 [Dokdonia sinensis]
MELYSPLHRSIKPLAIAVLGAIALISCSSSQTVYDEDGIYSNPASETEVVITDNSGVTSTGVAYKNYFEQKADALGQIPEEGAIFTDIESYTSTEGDLQDEEYYDDFSEGTGYRVGNAAWGEEVSDIVVNVYPSYAGGFWGGGFGFNQWGFNRFGWGGFGGGWGYYDPFFGPFYNGWGFGGFGYGFGAPWNPFCYGFNRPFYNRPFGNQHFNNGFGRGGNGIAYSRGRRNSASSAIAASRARLRESSRSRSVYSRDRGTVRPSSGNRGDARSSVRRSTNSARTSRPSYSRPASGARPSSPNTARSSTSRSRGNARPATRTSRSSTARSSSSSRPSYSRPSSSSRSSSARSSSSSRSSGSRSSSRSGGSSRRGGGIK